ncbi:MAG: hypothetical protein P8J37_11900 [Fuerstiella sp.]|nr:hypothetical protein [Fuerstiella sp.]
MGSHPISVTETQVFVTRTAARVRIKLFAEDLFLFQDLEPDTKDVIPANELSRGLEKHKLFLLDKFTLRDAKGDAFEGIVTDVRPFEIPEEGIPVDDLMLYTATYELEYPFAEPPEFLTLQQDISDENFIFPSEMKLTLHQAGTEMTYTESLKPGAAETLRFDWSQQQLTDDSSDEDWKAWFEKQREATLGITSYSSVYSFIYIEPAEVRHEVLIPLASLRTIIPMEHKDPAFIEVGEQDGVRELIRDWLTGVNPATINGVAIEPEFTRIDFYGLDLKDFARQAEQRRVSLANGRVGVIMTYRTVDDSIREAGVTWDKFHASLRKVQSVVFSYPDRIQRFEFSRFNEPVDNVYRFTADEIVLPQPVAAVAADLPSLPKLVIPVATICAVVLALACAIFGQAQGRKFAAAFCVLGAVTWPFARVELPHPFAATPEVTGMDGIFEQLHTGAYRALDFGSENRIYESLNQSVDGPLLESLYLQLRESLQIREQGGAVARVRAVEYDDGQQADNLPESEWPGFRYRSRWTVSGTVEHWGHVHERQNQFAALFSVEPRDGHWKITDMQIEDQQSIATKTRLRKF